MALYQHDAVSVNVGERLRELREARNISMRTLASRSGLSANALSMIERGKASPSVSTLYKLADALGSFHYIVFCYGNRKEAGCLSEVG